MKKNTAPRRLLSLLLSAALIPGLCACSPKEDAGATSSFFAMDTYMTVTVYGEHAEENAQSAMALVTKLDSLLSRTDPDSEISRINASGTSGCTVSEDTAVLISRCLEFSALTGGAFSAAIGPVMDAWGFGAGNESAFRVPTDSELAALLPLCSSDLVSVRGNEVTLGENGMILDLGGVGKGYAADRCAALLRERGVTSAIVSLGGNVYALGAKPNGEPWQVAVQSPDGSAKAEGTLSLADLSAVTTGGYRRFFEQDGVTYHHVIDPSTGYPADSGLLSATIVCLDSTMADILSTAVFVLGADKALELYRALPGFEMLLFTSDGEALVTPGMFGTYTPAPDSSFRVRTIK